VFVSYFKITKKFFLTLYFKDKLCLVVVTIKSTCFMFYLWWCNPIYENLNSDIALNKYKFQIMPLQV